MAFFLKKSDGRDKVAKLLKEAKAQMPPDVREAHKHSRKHRAEILKSASCGCFYCLRTFGPDEINEWIDQGDTALCPRCEIDSVLGSAAGFSLTKEFLEEMNNHWFGESHSR